MVKKKRIQNYKIKLSKEKVSLELLHEPRTQIHKVSTGWRYFKCAPQFKKGWIKDTFEIQDTLQMGVHVNGTIHIIQNFNKIHNFF